MQNKLKKLTAVACVVSLVAGCSKIGVTKNLDGSVTVGDGNGSCTVYIVEKDGYKFAVAVGLEKCAITQVRD